MFGLSRYRYVDLPPTNRPALGHRFRNVGLRGISDVLALLHLSSGFKSKFGMRELLELICTGLLSWLVAVISEIGLRAEE